jgi:hypothetical protein
MFRFTIREVLWLMAVVGLALAWRLENKQRQSGLEELKRLQVAADEQEAELYGVELSVLNRSEMEFRPALNGWANPTLHLWAKQRRKKRETEEALAGKYDPDKTLVGEWEVVEMIYKGTVQDFQGRPGGWMTFQYGKWSEAHSDRRYVVKYDYKIVGSGEMDIDLKSSLWYSGRILKCRYEHKDGNLRLAWGNSYDERPTHFNALMDSGMNFYVLKKVR